MNPPREPRAAQHSRHGRLWRRIRWAMAWLVAGAASLGLHAAEPRPLQLYAAASLGPALEDVAQAWVAQGGLSPHLVYAASSTLARQIEAGAPADLYASADRAWLDYLQTRDRLVPDSRRELLGNRLVLVALRGRGPLLSLDAPVDLAARFEGRLCVAQPGVVPAGIYAEQALRHLGAWGHLQPRLVATEDVRAALAFVLRGECALGVVYATDAQDRPELERVATFPADSHDEIVYGFARVRGAQPQASALLDFLAGERAADIFRRHGFLRREE